jgi:hypothetical protein
VFVPTDGQDHLGIVPGSGIVGEPQGDGLLLIHYEGNIYGSGEMQRYADRVYHAHGRHQAKAPTIARSLVGAERLVQIGRFDPVEGEVTLSDGGELALCHWLAVERIAPDELRSGANHFEQRRTVRGMLSSSDPAVQLRARWFVEHHGRGMEDLLDAAGPVSG